jgi:hypothetical protein
LPTTITADLAPVHITETDPSLANLATVTPTTTAASSGIPTAPTNKAQELKKTTRSTGIVFWGVVYLFDYQRVLPPSHV